MIGYATDVSSFSIFEKNSASELLAFLMQSFGKRAPEGERQVVEHERYKCYAYKHNGLVGQVIAEAAYPEEAAFSVIAKMLHDYLERHGDAWKTLSLDKATGDFLHSLLTKYGHDSAAATAILAVEKRLVSSTPTSAKTVEGMLRPGETLEGLISSSNHLSATTKAAVQAASLSGRSCC